MSKPETLYYLNDYTDEVVPCEPTLQAWANWVDKPDPDWTGREQAAEDGEEFAAHTIDILGDVRAEHIEGRWQAVEPVPEGTDSYFLRHHQGSRGWDAEFSGNTLEDAATELDGDEGPVWFACTRDGPPIRVRFERAPDGPLLTVIATQQ